LCWFSGNNTLTKNNANSNDHNGICLDYSSNNNVYLNNFIDNANSVYSYYSRNIWNSTDKITYIYNGSQCTNYLGNYWDDYKEKYPGAEEIDACGIRDTPYSINSDKDNYPLMERSENYFAPTKAIFRVHGKDSMQLKDRLYFTSVKIALFISKPIGYNYCILSKLIGNGEKTHYFHR
jgi:parallel beta-helix repeat protein